jgi:hypothetical protein
MSTTDNAYKGTDLKILVELTAPGFDMDTDHWTIGIKSRNKIVKYITKEEAVRKEDGWFVTVRAADLKPGTIEVVGFAEIPDEDFDDNIRNEVGKEYLLEYNKV